MDKVTRAVVDHYRARIEERQHDIGGIDASLLVDAVIDGLAQRLQLLIPRVYVVEFHRARHEWGYPVDASSSVAVDRYLEQFGAHTIVEWFERYPALSTLLDGVVDALGDHVAEIAQRWQIDREEIAAQGLCAPGLSLTGIDHLGSDAHQNGRTVAAVRLSDGSRVIYKPRSLGAEEFTRTALGIVSGALEIDVSMCAPTSLDRGVYGWQKEIHPTPAADADQVAVFYRRMGVLCAVLGALGAMDMHHENVLAVGDHPVALDLETVLHASASLRAHDLSAAISNRLKLSLANTLLLPQRLPSGPYSVLLGGIGVPYEQQSSRTEYVMVNRDTDAVDLAQRTFGFAQTHNVLHDSDGEVTDLLDHREHLLRGLREGWAAVRARREQIIDHLDHNPIELRQIFRSTAVYGRVLDAATHPDNLGRQDDFDRIVGMLRAPQGLHSGFVASFVVDAERKALARGDVPYFTVRSDELRARSERGLSAPIAHLSPRDRAAFGLRSVDDTSTIFEELLVEEGFAELRAVRRTHEPSYTPGAQADWGSRLLTDEGVDPDAVLHRLVDVSVCVQGIDGTERGWVPGAFAPTLATFDPGSSISFHDGGGIVVPFARAGGPWDEVAREAERGVLGLARVYQERLESLPWSIASGTLSLRYALGHDRTGLRVSPLCDDEDNLGRSDTMKGMPGAAALLSTFPDVSRIDLAEVAARMGTTAEGSGPLDLAHGPLGLTWAAHRVGRALDREQDVRAAEADFATTLAGRAQAPAGWCHGHAAACLVAAEIEADEDDVRWHARRAVALPEPGRPVALSVCHWAAGVVQSLVHLGQERGLGWATEHAAEHWARAARHARTHGYVTGDPARQGLLGYFLGWSGIADTGLLLRDALAGHRVWVPVAFAHSRRDDGMEVAA